MEQKRKIYRGKRHEVEFSIFRSSRFFVELRLAKSWSTVGVLQYSNADIADAERPWSGTRTIDVNLGVRILTGIFGAWRVDLAFGLAEVSLMWKWLPLPGWDALTGISFSLIPKERVGKAIPQSPSGANNLIYRVTKTWNWRKISTYPSFRERYELFKGSLCRDKIVRIYPDGSSEVIAEVERESPYGIKGV